MDKVLLVVIVMLGSVIISNPLSNPIANMYGPHFLLFYGFVISLTLIICRFGLSWDKTANLPTPLIPNNPDPYEIAYLRGGELELIKVVVANLIQKGFLKIKDNTITPTLIDFSKIKLELSGIEEEVLKNFKYPKKAFDLIKLAQLPCLSQYYSIYQQNLKRENLLFSNEIKTQVSLFKRLGTLIILGLGGYKLIIALSKGHTNVLFLIIFGTIATIILHNLCKAPRITELGKKYLNRLQQTFEQLKKDISINDETSEVPYSLAVAIFGVGILSSTPYKEFEHFFYSHPSTSNQYSSNYTTYSTTSCSGSDGGSCGGSCGGGCGGGCGGCGGCGG